MKRLALLALLLLAACETPEDVSVTEVSSLSGSPLLPAPEEPSPEPFFLAEHEDLPPEDAVLSWAWSPEETPRVIALQGECEAAVTEAVALLRAAGQPLSLGFAPVLPERGTHGVITVRLDPELSLAGHSGGWVIGRRAVSGEVRIKRCDPLIVAHELLHCAGFGHSTDPSHIMFFRVGGTVISQGEKAQLASR
jgi:hypothetical protein